MVKSEDVQSEKTMSGSIVYASTVRCKRYRNGRWVTYVEIEVVTKLPDGRIIKGDQLVSVQCVQEGRKGGN